MRLRTGALGISMLALSACTETGAGTEPGVIKELPEPIAALAAPNQDLNSVRILPEDGCFWYRHVGPVETTLLPLRTADGRPICAKKEA